MTTLKRILATTDFSELGNAAVHRAALLSARENADLLIVHAFPRQSALEAVFGSADDLPARLRDAANTNMNALVETVRAFGAARIRGEIVDGSAHRSVADAAEIFHPDLTVIGAHGKGALEQFFLGGTAARILSHATGPVLVTRRPVRTDYACALAAVDLGPRSETVLRTTLAVAAHARTTVLHAYRAPFEAKLRYKGFSEADILCYAETESRAAERNMAALLASRELAKIDIEQRIVHGDPNPAIPDAIRTLDADLVAVGKHGGSRLREAFMGSVSRFLAYYSPCDVLIA